MRFAQWTNAGKVLPSIPADTVSALIAIGPIEMFGFPPEALRPGARVVDILRTRLSFGPQVVSVDGRVLSVEGRGDDPQVPAIERDGAPATASAITAIDIIYFYPFVMPRSITFTNGLARVQTGGAGSSMKMGVWANSTISNRPLGAPLYKDDTGVATTASTGEGVADLVDALQASPADVILVTVGNK